MQDACGQRDVDEIVATARFRFANLVRSEDSERANALYTEVLATCGPAWPVHAATLNNRGITWLDLGQEDAAAADFTAVINTAAATDEARACALNNRGDIHDDHGDTAAAIADRTAVLNLNETTYDRRYIAYARRARTLWRIGDHEAALQDIEAILSTVAIAMEQKMAARLQRAQWLISSMQANAISDLETVVASVRNFPGDAERAQTLLTQTRTNDDRDSEPAPANA